VETLRKLFLGLTSRPVIVQPSEFFHHSNICYRSEGLKAEYKSLEDNNFISRLFDFLVMKLSENGNYRGKMIQFLSIPFYKLVFIPNKDAIKSAYHKPERLVIVFFDRYTKSFCCYFSAHILTLQRGQRSFNLLELP